MNTNNLELLADQLEELKQEQSILAAAPVHVHHTKCIRCGRALGNPKSMKMGMGPVCAKKAKAESEAAARYTAAKAAREISTPTQTAPTQRPIGSRFASDAAWLAAKADRDTRSVTHARKMIAARRAQEA